VAGSPASAGFGAGFRAMLPLWIGVVPFAAAYAVSARAAGLDPLHAQLMSLLVFAGGAQFAAVGLIAAGAGPWTLISTTFLLNLRHLLYGMVVARTTELRGARRLLAAHLLTDEAFGVHVAHGRGRPAFLVGAGLSLFVIWNAATLAGLVLARSLPDPQAIGLDIVFPLAFLALLVPLVRGGRTLLVASVAGLGAWGLGAVLEPGAALLLATVVAAGLGAVASAGPREAP